MADQKITELGALTGASVASGDQLVIVDVSDTSMAASGTDKKIGATELATAITTLGALATTAAVAAGYQPLDSDLTSIAALSTTTFGRSLLTQADASAARSTLGLGTAATVNTGTGSGDVPTKTQADSLYQPLDSDLTAIAALSTTSYGRAFLELANLAAVQAVLGTGTPSSSTFLRGDGTWSAPSGGAVPTFSATPTWRQWLVQANNYTPQTAGTAIYWPMIIPKALTVDAVAWYCNGISAGSSDVSIGWYTDSSYSPNSLIGSTTFSAVTTTGMKSQTFTGVALPMGLVWAAWLPVNGSSGTTSCGMAAGGANNSSPPGWLSVASGTGASFGGGTGADAVRYHQTGQSALPATVGSLLTGGNVTPPWISMRVA